VATIVSIYALGESLPIQALLLPLALFWVIVFIGSLINFLGAIAVYARDPITILPFALQIGLFISPVAYPADAVSGSADLLLALNPMTGLIEAVRWCMLPLDEVNTTALAAAGVWTVVVALVGWHVFARLETTFADYV
jgi:lipopolysaccharide transport system permease protein